MGGRRNSWGLYLPPSSWADDLAVPASASSFQSEENRWIQPKHLNSSAAPVQGVTVDKAVAGAIDAGLKEDGGVKESVRHARALASMCKLPAASSAKTC